MTHNSDCVVENISTVDTISDCFIKSGIEDWKPDRVECRQMAEDEGLTFRGSGAGRDVFQDSEDCVIKFSRGGSGRIMNKTEVEIWESAPEDLRKALVPVKDYDRNHEWLSMPYYEIKPRLKHQNEVRDKIRDAGWTCKDVNRGNVGVQHGESRLVDYGEGCSEGGRLG